MDVSSANPAALAGATANRFAGRYVVLDQLGAGGMGAVYRTKDEATQRTVAFKQLHSSAAGGNRRLLEALFEREYHTLARLKHPRIIEVFDYGLTSDGPYYTMELLDGKDLQQLAPLPYREACKLLRDVASSLALIHAHRLVHRDVSPRNVRLTRDGRAKLIDFGALAPFGPANEIVGTPACMAPEVYHRMPLDQRADLFALGVVGYWALTGVHAYPARRLQDLPSVWQQAPRLPSSLVSDIPPALDRLLLSLMNLDPLGRPASAAAVIDELTLIAKLEPEEHEQAAQSYLQSGPMVGRLAEREWVARRFQRLLGGKGAEMVVEGAAGIGKTRLLHEISLDAQLKGIVVFKADAQASTTAYGVVTKLAVQLLGACPELAREFVAEHAGLLQHLSPELKEKLHSDPPAVLADDPTERRARFQAALHAWFMGVAAKQPLLLCVDNIQAADDDSAAFLAALGHEARGARLIVLVTQRSGDAIVAPAPVRLLRKRSGHLKLGALSAAACEELMRSLAGDVANVGRVARLLFEHSAGNPQQYMDLAQLLVRKGIVKYVAGTWVLPLEVSSAEIPDRAEGILEARLALLRPDARELVEALSIHAKPIVLEGCLALADTADERDAYAALDELVTEQILLEDAGQYRFAQEALREAVLRRMDESKRRARHLRAAEMLLAGDAAAIGTRVEAAWHLLRAGHEGRGADLLAGAARQFLRREGGEESVEQVVRALDAAIDVYDREGRSDYELARLVFPIMPLAFLNDRRVALKYGARVIALGLKITGLGLAGKLRKFVGKRLALVIALVLAGVRFKKQQKRGLDYGLREAIGLFCGLIPSANGTSSICYDVATTQSLCHAIEPLRLFGPNHFASIMADFALTQLKMVQGYENDARVLLEKLVQQFRDPDFLQLLGETRWKTMQGGLLFSLGILRPYEFGNQTPHLADQMESLGIRIWSMAAAQIRLLHHALRGEIEQVEVWRNRVELFAVQGSSTWQVELFLPVLLLGSDVQVRDTIATRRTWEQLARRAESLPALEKYAEAAQAAYLALRGETAAAIALFERVIAKLPPRNSVSWSLVRAWFAEALNAAGEHARARAVALETLSHTVPGDFQVVGRYLEPQRQLALAEAGLGNHALAATLLDDLLTKYGHEDQPLLVGLLHKARAQVAIMMHDAVGLDVHLAEMDARFRGTRHPALIAQCERLAEEAIKCGLRKRAGQGERERTSEEALQQSVLERGLSELSAAADPYDHALRLLAHETQGSAIYLYLLERNTLRLVAASTHEESPRVLEERLHQLVERTRFEATEKAGRTGSATNGFAGDLGDDDGDTVFVASIAPEAPDHAQQVALMHVQDGGQSVVFGGVIVNGAPGVVKQPLDPDFLAAIASRLQVRMVSVGG